MENKEITKFLENDFRIYKNLIDIPLAPYPSYIQCGVIACCRGGNAKISVHGNEERLEKNRLVILFPGELVSLSEISPDFSVDMFEISQSLLNETLCGICRFSPHFFIYMRSHYCYCLNEVEAYQFGNYFKLIVQKAQSPTNRYREETVMQLLRVIYLDLYNDYANGSKRNVYAVVDTRKEELAYNFFNLIMEHYKKEREVAFYADKLCITPKYLSMSIKEVSGKTAKEWIVEYIVQEIKALLRNSTLSIQEIVQRTNFSNQSSLGRFFRKHTGMSPSQYRMAVQNCHPKK